MDMDTEIETYEDPESVQKAYAKTNFVLRETRKEILQQYGVDDEAALLEKIRNGEVDEHPGYDHYLSALILEKTRLYVRAEMMMQLGGNVSQEDLKASVHLMLKEKLEIYYAERLAAPLRMAQDALILSFDTGLLMEVRYHDANEYMISWSWGEADLRVDTAPTHPECETFPHHLHGEDGTILPDSVTLPGTDCWTNFSRLLDILLVNPLLESVVPA